MHARCPIVVVFHCSRLVKTHVSRGRGETVWNLFCLSLVAAPWSSLLALPMLSWLRNTPPDPVATAARMKRDAQAELDWKNGKRRLDMKEHLQKELGIPVRQGRGASGPTLALSAMKERRRLLSQAFADATTS